MAVSFATTEDAASALPEWQASRLRSAILTGNLATMARLHGAAPDILQRINLGGIHHQPGRSERLPYVYLTDAELANLRSLAADGATVTAQDVPTAVPLPLSAIK
jgi:PTS system mannose-specific IIB component/fructoselysine and glucoselysine-specific PTS system IIB component